MVYYVLLLHKYKIYKKCIINLNIQYDILYNVIKEININKFRVYQTQGMVILMRENYNSHKYWENVVRENKTIRGHMFMQDLPTEKSFYFHTMIFSKKNGINNVWGYFPNTKSLVGYVQYSFLQEAFYKWIYGKEKTITKIPFLDVEKVINGGFKDGLIDKNTSERMKKDCGFFTRLWEMRSVKVQTELKKFSREFNKKWMGDNTEFIYIKFFSTPKELGEFVVSSGLMTSTEEEVETKIGLSIDEWQEICDNAIEDSKCGEKFRKILLKNLSEVF